MSNNGGAESRDSKIRVHKPNRKTMAAKWNLNMLRALQKEIEKHPEKDMTTILTASYSQKLEDHKKISSSGRPRPVFAKDDVRSRLRVEDEAALLQGPSEDLQKSLFSDGIALSEAIIDLLDEAKVLYEGVWAASRMVFQLSDTLVVKFAEEESALDEYHALVFLRDELPDFPAPRPHGVVSFGCYGLLFTDYVAGQDMSKEWPRMSLEQKKSVSEQLNSHMLRLRSIPRPPNTPLGSLHGGRCRDGRRTVRVSTKRLLSA